MNLGSDQCVSFFYPSLNTTDSKYERVDEDGWPNEMLSGLNPKKGSHNTQIKNSLLWSLPQNLACKI